MGIGVAIGGYVFTMVNTLSEHYAKYYNWSDSEKTNKLIFLSTMVSIGGFFSFLIIPTLLTYGRKFALMFYCYVVIFTCTATLIKSELILYVARFL